MTAAGSNARKSRSLASAHNKLVRPLVIACLIATRLLTPLSHRMPSARRLAFTAAMRMVNRVHRNTAIMRPLAQPARASSFADGDVLMVDVTDLPNRRHAVLRNFAGFTRWQLHQGILAFFCH